MYYVKQYLLSVLIGTLFLFISCKKEQIARNEKIIPMETAIDKNQYNILKLSDYVQKLEYIPLETSTESLFPSNFDLMKDNIYYNKKYFVFPFTKKILKFSCDGEFMGEIGHQGQGPGGYSRACGMDVDEANNCIYIMDGATSINKFTIDGNYQKKITLNRGGLQEHFQKKFQLINENLFVFDLAFWKTHKYMIALSDSTSTLLNLMQDLQPEIKENGVGGLSDAIMYHFEEKVHYYKPIADTIYSIDASMSVKPEFIFDYGCYKYPLDQKKRVPADIDPGYVALTYLHESQHFLFMEFAFGALAPEPFEELRTFEGMTNSITNRYVKVLYNKSTGKVYLLKQPRKGDLGFQNDMEEGAPAFWPTFVSRDGTEMVMLYDAEKFIDNYSKVKTPSAKLKNVLKEIKFDNNPVAIIAKLK